MTSPDMSSLTNSPAPQRRVLRAFSTALATILVVAACDMSGLTGISCVGCAATTRLEIQGDTVLAVGDAMVLRAVAFQETILFDVRILPMRNAVWTSSAGGHVDVVAPPPVKEDTATWGRAILIGRTSGTVRITARAGGHEATKLVRVHAVP